jgi:aspartyl aminopeptidase
MPAKKAPKNQPKKSRADAKHKSLDTSLDLLQFIDASPTASHATRECVRRLESKGFTRLCETDKWEIKPGGCYYVIRNDSSIIAARVGTGKPAEHGFRIIGAHTDFPGLRLKPNGIYSKNGYIQLGVEVYGGPIIHTWTDRDLGIAGRLAVEDSKGNIDIVLFNFNRPVCRIPNLAPHIKIDKNAEVKFNKQDHLPPVIGIGNDKFLEDQPVLKLIAKAADGGPVNPSKINSHSVEIYDLQPGTIGGMNDDFIFTRSIDNLAACHAAIEALLSADKKSKFTQLVALFDNEEVGSGTMQGAGSGFLESVIARLCESDGCPGEGFYRSMANSILISADGAHAVNPNYPEAHEPRHHPILNGGPVIKVNSNERYTTEIKALAHLKKCAKIAGSPLQTFVARTDVGTGSTIGPMTSAKLGLRSIDIGSPMISMHSSREMGGSADQLHMINLMREHFSID